MNYLEYIKKHREEIQQIDEVFVPFAKINKPEFADIQNKTFQAVLKEYKERGKISRSNIFDKVSSGKLYEAFLLIILWGNLGAFSTSKKDNVKLATANEDEVKKKLDNVKELIKKRPIGDFSAFVTMLDGENHIDGIGISFLTKILYFFDYPKEYDSFLIFDKWSQREHCAMVISSGDDDYKTMYKLTPTKRSVKISMVGDSLSLYKDYIHRISNISQLDGLKVDADKLEEFLFGYNDNKGNDKPRKFLINFLKTEYQKESSTLKEEGRNKTNKYIKDKQKPIQKQEFVNGQRPMIYQMKEGHEVLEEAALNINGTSIVLILARTKKGSHFCGFWNKDIPNTNFDLIPEIQDIINKLSLSSLKWETKPQYSRKYVMYKSKDSYIEAKELKDKISEFINSMNK